MRALVLVALLAACGRDEPPPKSERAPSIAACFGDELGKLRAKPSYRDCKGKQTACREECSAGDGEACFALALDMQMGERKDPIAYSPRHVKEESHSDAA